MAKTYVNTTKYLIVEEFEINGVVDKPDIIGAIFGQSEGLLGSEMDLRELQNNGRVGRIEIKLESKDGKTFGQVLIPSSMDVVETSILAAAVETVDKVGPCESKFKTAEIRDTRADKRKEVEERAKELLKSLLHARTPESMELASKVRLKARTEEISEFGLEKLPCGSEVVSSNELIVVEGRADVLTLLRNNIKNVIGMEGSKSPQDVIDLCQRKTVTVFIDGDRGGELNARKLASLTKVDFIARAPDGKEVEELTQKEVLQALKHRIPVSQFLGLKALREQFRTGFRQRFQGERQRWQSRPPSPVHATAHSLDKDEIITVTTARPSGLVPAQAPATMQSQARVDNAELGPLKEIMGSLKGSFNARLLNENNELIKEVPVRELSKELEESKGVKKIVFDGIITQRLVDAAEKNNIGLVAGIKKGKIERGKGINLIVL